MPSRDLTPLGPGDLGPADGLDADYDADDWCDEPKPRGCRGPITDDECGCKGRCQLCGERFFLEELDTPADMPPKMPETTRALLQLDRGGILLSRAICAGDWTATVSILEQLVKAGEAVARAFKAETVGRPQSVPICDQTQWLRDLVKRAAAAPLLCPACRAPEASS